MVPAGGSHTLSCPSSVTSVNHLATLPSMIFGHACLGLPPFFLQLGRVDLLLLVDLRLAMISSLSTTIGFIAATCIAALSTNAVKLGVLRVGPLGVDEHRELAARVDVGVDEAVRLLGLEPTPSGGRPCSRPSWRRARARTCSTVLSVPGYFCAPRSAPLGALLATLEHVLHEALEVVAARDEVRLAVDLDDDAALAVRRDPRGAPRPRPRRARRATPP